MTTSEWLKPGIYGALLGAVFVGFGWVGWITGDTVDDLEWMMAREDFAGTRNPNPDGSQARHALTMKLDHPVGAGQSPCVRR